MRVGQILTNFLLNAVQSIESEGSRSAGRIWVEVDRSEGFGRVRVTDDGPGIPPEVEIAELFQPFTSTRLEAGGSGLGLAVSTQIAESLGGAVALRRSDGGRGAVAERVLPLFDEGRSDRDAGGSGPSEPK